MEEDSIMVFHVYIDNGPVELSEMRVKNFYRAVIEMLRGKVTLARYKCPDGHWMVTMWTGSSLEDTWEKIRAMVPTSGGFLSSFDKKYEFEEVP